MPDLDDPETRAKADGAGLRIALFSGNYNCVRDGANRALKAFLFVGIAYFLVAWVAGLPPYGSAIDDEVQQTRGLQPQ